MDFETIRDKDDAVIGFSLISGSYTEEDLFVSNLSNDLKNGRLVLAIVKDKLSIDNGRGNSVLFKVPPDELSVLGKYIASNETEAEIKKGGLIPTARIIFSNEKVRKDSLEKKSVDNTEPSAK